MMDLNTPYLDAFAKNLSESVKHKDNKSAVGRDDQIESTIQVLMHRNKNTPMLVGEAGVGKTDLVEGLAERINANAVPNLLQGYQILSLNLGILDANKDTGELGFFNDNLSHIIDECSRYKKHLILFIDEFHTIMGASKNGVDSGMDGSQLLKPPLARGEIKLIGATTFDEFYDYVEPDRALQRRLDVIGIPEPNFDTTCKILNLNINSYTKHYDGITIDEEVIKRVVTLAIRYLPDRFLPDKAFDIMDASFSEAMLNHSKEVTFENVAKAIYRKTGIPMSSIAKSLQPQIVDLRPKLEKRLKGQEQAVNSVVKAVDMFFAGLNDPSKPKSSFLFLGTTGVGKTELAKALAESLFDSEDSMIRLDMSSFNTKDASAKLIGVNGKRGILTEAVRRKPYSVLLLDEIEKSSPDVWDLLLSILDDGEIQDSRGRTVDFTNLIIILTSNLAAETIKNRQAWEAGADSSPEEVKYREMQFNAEVDFALKRTFRPELVNRLANRVIFNVLDKPQIVKIAQKYMETLISRLNNKGYDLMYDFDVIDYLTDIGTDIDNGARPLQRALDQEITGLISENIVKIQSDPNSKFKDLRTFVLSVDGMRPYKGLTKSDLWGSRQFVCMARRKPLTENEKFERKEVFSEENIIKMLELHVEKPDVVKEAHEKIKNISE